MTNKTKWLVAVPFSVLVGLAVPAMITGGSFWFLNCWSDTLYIILSTGMWLAATAFVDLSKPRGRPDLANRLISLGLIFSVPISVADRSYFLGAILPGWLPLMGLGLSLIAIMLGLWARITLGQSYSPRGQTAPSDQLIQTGPYRWIRHPLYSSACLWALCWPLLIRSLLGALFTGGLVVFAVLNRIAAEERSLLQSFGASYREYQKHTWRLIPYIY
jgi:protein-S-isoprenylcysteine O-methyltransferase Ste14